MNAYLLHCNAQTLDQFLSFLDHQHFGGFTALDPNRLLVVLPRTAQGDDTRYAAHRSVSDSLSGMMRASGITVQAVTLADKHTDPRTVTRQTHPKHWVWVSDHTAGEPTQSAGTMALWSGHFLSHSTEPVPKFAALS